MELSWLLLKNSRSLLRMVAKWDWSGCDELSKMSFAEWMELVMTIILEMLSLLQAWLIPHLTAKSSASELVTNTVWWTVLMRGGISLIYMCNRCSNVVFDTGISYNESGWRKRVLENQIIKFLSTNVVFSFFID